MRLTSNHAASSIISKRAAAINSVAASAFCTRTVQHPDKTGLQRLYADSSPFSILFGLTQSCKHQTLRCTRAFTPVQQVKTLIAAFISLERPERRAERRLLPPATKQEIKQRRHFSPLTLNYMILFFHYFLPETLGGAKQRGKTRNQI